MPAAKYHSHSARHPPNAIARAAFALSIDGASTRLECLKCESARRGHRSRCWSAIPHGRAALEIAETLVRSGASDLLVNRRGAALVRARSMARWATSTWVARLSCEPGRCANLTGTSRIAPSRLISHQRSEVRPNFVAYLNAFFRR